MQKAERIRTKLIEWFQQHQRSLPWRGNKDPYIIWVAEIIFQQTRIDQGLTYFDKFVSKFPNLNSLANSDEETVLKVWQGLGYYSRARNMHHTAKMLVDNFDSKFPESSTELKKLKGIGDYTAACMASICFNEPVPAIDGNAFRVLSRIWADQNSIYTGSGKRLFSKLAMELLDLNHPGEFNEAMMELGALVCSPQKPDCDNCPIRQDCLAFKQSKQEAYPVRKKKPVVKIRELNFLYVEENQSVWLEKRGDKDIWRGLYQLIEITNGTANLKLIQSKKHRLTHRLLHIDFYEPGHKGSAFDKENKILVPLSDLDRYAYPNPIRDFLYEQAKFYFK